MARQGRWKVARKPIPIYIRCTMISWCVMMCHTLALLFNYVHVPLYIAKRHAPNSHQKNDPFPISKTSRTRRSGIKSIGFVIGVRSQKAFPMGRTYLPKNIKTIKYYGWWIQMIQIQRSCGNGAYSTHIPMKWPIASINSTGHNWSIDVSVKWDLDISLG